MPAQRHRSGPPAGTERAASSIPSLILRVAAVVAVLLMGMAQPAAADTTVEVTTPTDGHYQPGKPVVLLVSVTADQAIAGTIEVTMEGEVDLIPAQAIEVPGGSTKTFAVPVEFPPWFGGVGVVVRTSEGETKRLRPNLRTASGAEPIAVMPSLAVPGIPERVDLLAEDRQGRVVLFDPANLEHGVASLNGSSAVLAGESDLTNLADNQLAVVRSWVASGGRLVMDGSADRVPDAFSDLEFAPSSDGGPVDARAWLGSGAIYLAGDNLANGRFDDLLSPRFADGDGEFSMEAEMGMFDAGGGTIEDLAADAGFRARPIGVYAAVLLGYIALVGPIMWLVLSRRQREPAVWLIVPALAMVFSFGVWGAGRFFRQGSTGSHVTVVGDLAGSTFVDTTYLLASANGGTTGIELDDGWDPAASSVDPWDWRLQQANLPPLELTGRRLSADVPPAGLVLASAVSEDVQADNSSWTVDGSYVDGRFQGTATNNTGLELTEVVMYSGGTIQNLDDVSAGGSISFDVRAGQPGSMSFENSLAGRFSGPGGQGDADSPSAALRWLSRHTDATSTNFIVGWTTDDSAPLGTIGGDGVAAGRTGYLTVLPTVTGPSALADLSPGSLLPTRVAITDFRWSGEPGANVLGQARGNIFEGQVLSATIELPPGLDPDTPLSLRVAPETAALDIWNGTEWVDSGLGEQDPRREVDLPLPANAREGGTIRVKLLSDYPFTAPTVVVTGGQG